MSADDSIEIEFPSLKQSAPQLVERVEPERAPGPIEAQLSSTSGDDDLSWLSAIFVDDDDEDAEADEAEVKANPGHPAGTDASDAGAPDHIRAEPPAVPDGVLDGPPADLSGGPGDLIEDELIDDDHDLSLLDHSARGDIEEAALDESEPMVDSDRAPKVVDSDPIDADTDASHPESSSPQKKVTGFREEIMSTFSQMYN